MKDESVKVRLQMLSRNDLVRSFDTCLQMREERFDRIDVYVFSDILTFVVIYRIPVMSFVRPQVRSALIG